jgi:cysteinyl-tRNA synthetase
MPLRLYNTLTRSSEEFTPLDGNRVRVYACGPTVYRAPHIGNFRAFVFYDVLHRYLEWKGWDVTFVMNLTDVEDKIIDAAAEQSVTIEKITAPQIDAFLNDLRTLGIRPADAQPRATQHMDDMVRLIERLIERGHAYVKDGSVYYDISSFPEYGRLSRIDLDAVRSGAGLASRTNAVDADEYDKEDARDFALWKAAKDRDRAANAAWPAPWGEGRPGWHIECSAMSMAALGETFDIHTGGEDLIFPHHEDEIAQSEGATGKPFVRTWLHVTHLKVGGEKMSKSKRNDYRITDLLERGISPAAIRYQLLQAHYRNELSFTLEGLRDAETALQRLVDFRARLASSGEETRRTDSSHAEARSARRNGPLAQLAADALAQFEAAMDDDLNTPNALAVVFPFVREVNAALDRRAASGEGVSSSDLLAVRSALDRMDAVLGVIELAEARASDVDEEMVRWIEAKLEERRLARVARDFARADAIRAELGERGIIVEDTAQGVRWKRA